MRKIAYVGLFVIANTKTSYKVTHPYNVPTKAYLTFV
jgi:hypothetical protein